jgi:hypothetical protein
MVVHAYILSYTGGIPVTQEDHSLTLGLDKSETLSEK